jgi:DNA-binding CsgD family transcriptional regulator
LPVTTPSTGPSPWNPLSRREGEVLAAACTGASNDEIAARLRISCRTVESHLHHVYAKLGVRGRAAAMHWALAPRIDDLRQERSEPEAGLNREGERRSGM